MKYEKMLCPKCKKPVNIPKDVLFWFNAGYNKALYEIEKTVNTLRKKDDSTTR